MNANWHVTLVVALGVTIAVLIEAAYNSQLHLGVIFRIAMASAIVNALITVFDRYLWQCKLFQGWLVDRPNISGKWQVTITPLTPDPSIGKPRAPRRCTFEIRQTYSELFIRMLGSESDGETISTDLRRAPDGRFELIATYRNLPRMKVRSRSHVHVGTMLLYVSSEVLAGNYWTDRPTRGEIHGKRAD